LHRLNRVAFSILIIAGISATFSIFLTVQQSSAQGTGLKENPFFDPFAGEQKPIYNYTQQAPTTSTGNNELDLNLNRHYNLKPLFTTENPLCTSIFKKFAFEISNNLITTPNADNLMDCKSGVQQGAKNDYVVWSEGDDDNRKILFSKSINGETFSNPIQLNNFNQPAAFNPKMATSGNNIYVVWQGDSPTGNQGIFIKKSTDFGRTFGNAKILSIGKGGFGNPDLVVDGNNVHVTWAGNTPGNDNVYYRVSNDGGATFGTQENISNSKTMSFAPKLRITGNNVDVYWKEFNGEENNIFVKKSLDGGDNFSVLQLLNASAIGGVSPSNSIS
jgi:hypothetical protein